MDRALQACRDLPGVGRGMLDESGVRGFLPHKLRLWGARNMKGREDGTDHLPGGVLCFGEQGLVRQVVSP